MKGPGVQTPWTFHLGHLYLCCVSSVRVVPHRLRKQDDDLKKRTMDKTLETTLKARMNTKLMTCDDKGVFTDDEGTYRKHKLC